MQLGTFLPAFNACCNATSAALLVVGFAAIREKKVVVHRRCMVAAFIISCLFLISYLTRFYLTGVHRFPGEGLIKVVYLTILGSHTALAAVVPFLAIRTLYLAARGRFEAHKKIARITFPIWLYVSLTGVIVYLMLYRL